VTGVQTCALPICSAQTEPVPNTNNAISLRVKFPKIKAIQAVVIEGGALTLRKEGFTVVIAPSVSDTADGSVRLGVFQPDKNSATESLREVKTFTVSINSNQTVKTDLTFKVKVERVTKFVDQARNAGAVLQRASYSPVQSQGECCVTCNGVTACTNCSVTVECGTCCTDFCRTRKLCPKVVPINPG